MKHHYSIIIFLIISFYSCKKDSNTSITISGVVADKNTNVPIAFAEVDLIEYGGGFLGGSSSSTLQRMYADAIGRFTFFNVNINSEKTYIVLGYKNLYFNDGNNTADVNINQPNVVVPMQPMAWLKLHVKDTSPYDKFDYISFSSPWGGGAGPFNGVNVDTILFAQVYGNENTIIFAFITKNGIKSTVSKNIICPAFDTTLYNLNY